MRLGTSSPLKHDSPEEWAENHVKLGLRCVNFPLNCNDPEDKITAYRDALICADIGAKAIIVSHHHGRMPYAVPPMMILPEIREALDGKDVKIIVDCGIESGADVYKAIALGADAAAVGRSMMPYLEKDGASGVESYLTKVQNELRYIMSNTGFAKVSDIDDSALWFN